MCGPGRPSLHIWEGLQRSEKIIFFGAQACTSGPAICAPRCADLDVQVCTFGQATCPRGLHIWASKLRPQMCRPLGQVACPNVRTWTSRSAHLGRQIAPPDVQGWGGSNCNFLTPTKAQPHAMCLDLDVQVCTFGEGCLPKCADLDVQVCTFGEGCLPKCADLDVQVCTFGEGCLPKCADLDVQVCTFWGGLPTQMCGPGRPGLHIWGGLPTQMCGPGRPGLHIWEGCLPAYPNVRTWTSRSAHLGRVGHPPKKENFD